MITVLTALQAGCQQRPVSGLSIGLRGNIFSPTPVQVTFPGDTFGSEEKLSSKPKRGLSREAIIGIAVGVGAAALLGTILVVCCLHRRRKASNMTRLRSPLDSRFGSKSITSPNSGAYGNPYARPLVNVNENFTANGLEELEMATPLPSAKAHANPLTRSRGDTKRLDTSSVRVMPTHQAYIPGVTSPGSPSTNIANSANSHNTSYAHAKTPPNYILEYMSSPQAAPDTAAPEQANESIVLQSRHPDATKTSRTQPSRPENQTRAVSNNQSQTSRIYARRDRSNSRARDRSRSTSRHRGGNGSTSQSNTIAERWKRATMLMGVGNANASQERPIHTSTTHGNRFDFALAEKERRKGKKMGESVDMFFKRRKADNRPSSAGTEGEQWPGNY